MNSNPKKVITIRLATEEKHALAGTVARYNVQRVAAGLCALSCEAFLRRLIARAAEHLTPHDGEPPAGIVREANGTETPAPFKGGPPSGSKPPAIDWRWCAAAGEWRPVSRSQ